MDPKRGVLSAVTAFALWGFLPLFWKQLESLPSLTIVCHRTLWGLPLLFIVLLVRRKWQAIPLALRSPRMLSLHFLSGSLLAGNWLLYIWSTINDRMLEGALGYYLNPFLNMLFGFLWFGERHNPTQLAAIGLAMAGVALQFPAVDGWPWVAITLALSFALYGVLRKRASLDSFEGLTLETTLMAPFALAWLVLHRQDPVLPTNDPFTSLLVLLAIGGATVLPLLCFGYAARNISLTTLGILQFIGPSIQFLIGWLLYHEPMPPMRLLSFALIWIAIFLYTRDARRKLRPADG